MTDGRLSAVLLLLLMANENTIFLSKTIPPCGFLPRLLISWLSSLNCTHSDQVPALVKPENPDQTLSLSTTRQIVCKHSAEKFQNRVAGHHRLEEMKLSLIKLAARCIIGKSCRFHGGRCCRGIPHPPATPFELVIIPWIAGEIKSAGTLRSAGSKRPASFSLSTAMVVRSFVRSLSPRHSNLCIETQYRVGAPLRKIRKW